LTRRGTVWTGSAVLIRGVPRTMTEAVIGLLNLGTALLSAEEAMAVVVVPMVPRPAARMFVEVVLVRVVVPSLAHAHVVVAMLILVETETLTQAVVVVAMAAEVVVVAEVVLAVSGHSLLDAHFADPCAHLWCTVVHAMTTPVVMMTQIPGVVAMVTLTTMIRKKVICAHVRKSSIPTGCTALGSLNGTTIPRVA
jgi:hypothetical protein